jgi:large subunit ribosomal protein L9
MKVILKKDVQSLGETGDIVEVKNGYARNYLLPLEFAEIATEGSLKNRERNLARIKTKAEKLHQQALEQAEKIKALGQIEITAKAGENGKLFGAITTRKLAEVIQEKSGLEVDRRNISLDNPINHLGTYKMKIKLTSKVEVSLPVSVSASEIVKEEIPEEVAE